MTDVVRRDVEEDQSGVQSGVGEGKGKDFCDVRRRTKDRTGKTNLKI